MQAPSKMRFVIAGLIALAGITAAVSFVVLSIVHFGGAFVKASRTHVPGTQRVHLDARKYVIYVESSQFGDAPFPGDDLAVTIRDASEHKLALSDYSSNFTITVSSRSERAYKTVEPSSAGTYEISTEGSIASESSFGNERSAVSDGTIVLGRPLGGRVVHIITVGLLLGLIPFIVAIALAIHTASARSRFRQRQQYGGGGVSRTL